LGDACAGKEAQLQHRYEMAHERSLRAMLKELAALEKSGADYGEEEDEADGPQTPASPAEADPPGPAAPADAGPAAPSEANSPEVIAVIAVAPDSSGSTPRPEPAPSWFEGLPAPLAGPAGDPDGPDGAFAGPAAGLIHA
jgi:hypothetical protein